MSEIIIVCGFPSAGKSTISDTYVAKGYQRFCRDEIGGSVYALALRVEQACKQLKDIQREIKFVVDGLFPDPASRKPIIEAARKHGIPVFCLVLGTSIEDAQYNNALRQIRKWGQLIDIDDYQRLSKSDPGLYPPAVLFRYRNEFKAPSKDEGFADIITLQFQRIWEPDYVNKGLILDYDGCLRTTSGTEKYPTCADEVRILPRRAEILKAYLDKGYILCGVSNQSGIATGMLSEDDAIAAFERTNQLLGLEIDYKYCPHRVGPPVGIPCYCRKPMPGLAVHFIEKYKLNPQETIFVGDMKTDETFAKRSGLKFQHASIFFGDAQESLKKIRGKSKTR